MKSKRYVGVQGMQIVSKFFEEMLTKPGHIRIRGNGEGYLPTVGYEYVPLSFAKYTLFSWING